MDGGELTGKAPADTISIDLSLSWQQKAARSYCSAAPVLQQYNGWVFRLLVLAGLAIPTALNNGRKGHVKRSDRPLNAS
jgi:hypothetical protein